jgi:hypothetical protein
MVVAFPGLGPGCPGLSLRAGSHPAILGKHHSEVALQGQVTGERRWLRC